MHAIASSHNAISLPRELQLRILAYTDLVTPLSSVNWDPYKKYHLGIKRVKSCHLYNGEGCGPPYDQCHSENHTNCRGYLRPTGDSDVATDGREFCDCPHASESHRLRGMASCRSCTHYACQFLPERQQDYDASVHWAPPIALFLVSREFKDLSSAVFFGRNHFKVSCGYREASSLQEISNSRAGSSTFLCDILPNNARHFLRSLEIDLTGISSYAAMQEWLRVAQNIGPQLRLKVLRLIGESPVDGLQDVADWRHGQDAVESVRLARNEVATWMWPPLGMGAANVISGTGKEQEGTARKPELFKAKILCTSHDEGEHIVWYSIGSTATVTRDESLPQWAYGLSCDHELVLPNWCHNVRMPLPSLSAGPDVGLQVFESEIWVEDVLVSSYIADYAMQ